MSFYQAAGGMISGGFGAVNNVIASVGSGVSTMFSGFFPTAQRKTPIISNRLKPIENTGLTYRQTNPDAPSLPEIADLARNNWMGSIYQDQLAPGPNYFERESDPNIVFGIKTAADNILGLSASLSSAVTAGGSFVDEIRSQWGLNPRSVNQNTAGETVIHLQDDRTNAPDTTAQEGGLIQGFISQLKGLFNTGFPQEPQPTPAIPSPATPIATGFKIGGSAVVLVAVGGLVYFLFLRD